jgi:Ca2+-binding EF-hand superfamily protein
MSYRRPKIQNVKPKKKKTEITQEVKEIKNKEEEEENIEYNEDNLNEVIKAFEYFDMNHSGKIKVSDLTKALSTFGDIMTEEEMFNIFREAGIQINTDEEIDYIKFINFWIGNN